MSDRLGALLPCYEHNPPTEVTGTVLFLHGLGADGYDFAPYVPQMQVPGVRFIFPHAEPQPVTINAGYVMPSWYDIRSLDPFAPHREDPAGVKRSAEHIRALIAREAERGVPPSRVVLAGFSQGGAMALYVGLRHEQPLAGLAVLSGYLVLPETLEQEASPAVRQATVWFGHGTYDEVVPVVGGRLAYEATRALGATASWQEWPMGHEVSAEEMRQLRNFFSARLG